MPGAAVAAGRVGRRVSNLESLVEGAGWRAWTEWQVHAESSSLSVPTLAGEGAMRGQRGRGGGTQA